MLRGSCVIPQGEALSIRQAASPSFIKAEESSQFSLRRNQAKPKLIFYREGKKKPKPSPKRRVLNLSSSSPPSMATSKTYYARPNYRYLPTDHHHQTLGADSAFELDESDIYNFARSSSPEYRKPAMSSRVVSSAASKNSASSKRSDAGDRNGGTAASLPVGIPDWSKILRDEYRENRRSGDDDDDECLDGSVRVPPHEFLARQMARTRIASFSVHEGVGRTLKGRDLSRVRNAIWEKTGFED